MSGNPNWNPPLQTSSVRFPRKAVETPVIPANSTTRQRPGAPFQPVFSSQITIIPTISSTINGSGSQVLSNALYTISSSYGDALAYNVTRRTIRGVPAPEVLIVASAERYLIFTVSFPYPMTGTDHFVFTFKNQYTNETLIKNYQRSPQYLVGGILPGVIYTLTVAPHVNGITYPASPPTAPFSITAVSEKNIRLQGVTLSGANKGGYVLITGATPLPPTAFEVTKLAVDDNFGSAQQIIDLVPPSATSINRGYVFVSNLTNGSSYILTVRSVHETGGVYEYGQPTALPPYIPGPPSDIYFTSITANVTTAFLSSYYDTVVHPTPVSNRIEVYKSSFSTLCSYFVQPTTRVQDLSETYASFTTSTSLFTTSDISSMIETVSATPGSIQVEITNNRGYWYTFPLTNISRGGLGYTFGNSNFTKTVSLATETVSAYTIVFHSVRLSTSPDFTSNYLPPATSFIFTGNLQQSNYTFVGRNFANGLPSTRPTYTTIAVGEPYGVTTISAESGNHIVTLSFSGYDELSTVPRPRPTRFLYSDNYGNTYTTINSNITINGLTNGSLYTFTILSYANTVYGPGVKYSITPTIQPPSNLTYEISNYNVTLSFTSAIGGADFYAVGDNSGHVVSSFPYRFVDLSANFPYVFTARAGSYNKATYTLSAGIAPDRIRESPVGYARFFVDPSTIPYVENVRQLLDQFVPYIYTITSSGQPIPSPIQTVSPAPSSPPTLTASGSSLLLLKYWSIAATTAALSDGYAVTASARGISYTVTSITTVSDALGNLYNSFNGGPSSLSTLAGQNLAMELIPVSNAFTFPIRSITPAYDGNGILTGYTVENSSVLKSVKTFSGATTYNTVLTAGIPFYQDMVPTDFSGTVYSVSSLPTTPSAYVGPPGTITFTASSYLSQEILLTVSTAGFVNPSSYTYVQVGGTISGTTTNSNIDIKGLTDGSSYSFYVNAFGNLAAGPSSQTIIFNLCTDSPRNLSSSFSNLTATLGFNASVPPATTYYANMYKSEYVPGSSIPIQSVSSSFAGQFPAFSPVGIDANTLYSFVAYGVLNGISSTPVKVSAIISGPPFTPTSLKTYPSSNQIIFNWSSGNIAYSESYRITEYYSNNPTGGLWEGIVDLAKTISAVVTTSLTQSFGATQWAEVSPGYASFVLSNGSLTNAIDNRYLSNLVYITIEQSGDVSYTFPATQSSNINTNFNAYFNTSYPKTPGNLFNPTLSVSVTYSWGTGPFNYGTYSYTLDALANQVYSISSNVTVQMFTLPVSGVPTVSVSGTTATISFADTGVAGVSYKVTNNFGSNVSTPPYEFRNLLTTSAYTFSVVSSNGTFTSISSESTLPTYVGPPRQPEFVLSTYYGRTVSAYATDTTLSLGTFFYDTGTQGTGNGIGTISHANVIQTGSGNGYWSGGNGNIKDTLSGFVLSAAQGEVGSTVYSNDGIIDAIYQFRVTPSIGTLQVSLSSYLLSITGGNYVISKSGSSLRTGTITISSYPIQFVSRSNVFAIQTGLSSLYYTTVPALTDALTISLAGPASFSNFTSYSLNQTGVATVSYVFTDNLGTTYTPISTYPIYSLSGITYTNTLTDVLAKNRLVISVIPYANNVSGIAGTTSVFISTESPGIPVVVFTNTNAVVTVPKVADNYIVENYNLATYSNNTYKGKQTQPASAATSYTFNYTDLTNHANYYFEAYAEYLGISSEVVRSTPTQEAGSPYSLVSLTPTFTTSSYLLGTCSISAVLDVGANSNGTTSVYVYKAGVFVASDTKSLNGSSLAQTYTFSVSSGAVYTLSSSVVQNTVVTRGPVATISAVPFSPQAVGITISSSDIGVTYRGIVSVNVPSSTVGVTYKYLYATNGALSRTVITSGNTFTATYGQSYIGYAYAETTATPTLSSSITSSSPVCNVSYGSPSNAVATYLGSNITVNWSSAPVLSYYTVRETGGQLDTSQNIGGTTANFVGILGKTYQFSVRAQSGATNDLSLLYSLPSPTNQITLATSSVTKLNIDYFGNTITLSWTNVALNYVYTISQTQGPTVTDFKQPTAYLAAPLPTTDSVTITNVPLSNTYKFAIKTNLFGVSGSDTLSLPVTLSTGPMTNVSQSYYGNVYTISWATHPQSPATYTVQEINGNYKSFSLQTTVCSIILSYDTSYNFQTFATYKGISGTATTLSAIYTYTLPIPNIPTTTYNNKNITVSWSAAPQEDGSLYPDSYLIKDILNNPPALSGTARSLSESIVLVGSYNMSYQFTVTPSYKGIAGLGISGSIVSLYTPPPTNVTVDNSGRNLYITWIAVQGTGVTYSISQKYGSNVMNGVSSGLTTTTFLSPLTAVASRTISYNFGITALLNGISSAEVVSPLNAYVYTYPPANVGIYYLGEPSSNTLTVYWTISSTQTGNSFYVRVTDPESTSPFEGLSDINSSQYIIRGKSATSNHTYTPFVYAIRNGLSSEETIGGTAIRLFTPQPSFVGAGFDGNYAITVNVCSGPDATPDTRFKRPDTYTLTETSNLFFPKESSWTFPAAPIAGSAVAFQIPTLAARGLTYNFSLYATMCGLVSIVDPSYGVRSISITTNPVSGSTLFANYSGTIITVSWADAKQPALNTPSNPNGGYTLYVSSLPFPLTTLYKDTSFKWAGGVPGGTYQFSVEATNNNVGSALVTSDAAIVTLYKPTVQFLTVTNSGGGTTDPSNVKMILDWFPDPNVETETYIASLFSSVGTELSSQTLAANAQTATFTGSLGSNYFFRVTGIYKGISGDPATTTISNTRPVLTSASVLNNGTQVIVNYTANDATYFDVSMRPTNGGTVIPGFSNNSSYSFTVTPSTGIGYRYTISVTAYNNGLPSLLSNLSTTIIQPDAPPNLTFGYSNNIVSASWGIVTSASSYTFQAWDTTTASFVSIQPGLTTRSATFTGTVGRTFSLGVYAFSSTQVASAVTTSLVTLVIPPPPSNLALSNTGQTVIVNWSEDAVVYNNYSFYVSNVNQRGVIVYSTEYARSGDTFQGSIGQTYSVSLYGTSVCNITSTDSVAKQWQVYQPYTPFVSATNTGADIFLQWPRDEKEICVFYLTNNYTYCNLLFPDPTGYTTSKNGWIVTPTITPNYLTNPATIPNCSIWLDASVPTSVTVASGKVTQWKSITNNISFDAVIFSGANPITYTTDGVIPILQFNSGEYLKSATTFTDPIYTAFVVAKATGIPVGAIGSLLAKDTTTYGIRYNTSRSIYKKDANDFGYVSGYNVNGSKGVVVNLSLSIPAGYNIIDVSYAGSAGFKHNIGYSSDANSGFIGNVAEVLIYTRALTTTERAQIQTYLSRKWNITMTAGFVPVSFGPPTYGPPYTYTHDPRYDTSPTATLSANYTQVGGYVKYTVSSNAYNTAGTAYIFSVKPYFNQAGGNAVTTNEQDPIILYQPTQVGELTSTIVGNVLTLNWQYAVVYTNPAELVQSYTVEICAAAGAYVSCNVVGTTQTFTNFTENSGILSISVTAVAPSTGYGGSKIYGTTKFIQTVIPSLNRVSIKQSLSTSPQTIDVTIPPLLGTYIWFVTTASAAIGATNPPVCNVLPSTGSATQQTYQFDVTLGYKYTISAYGWPTNTGLDIATAATIPANQIPYPVTTFAVVESTLSTSHYGSSVTISWGAVAGAAQYDVQEYNADGTGGGGTLVSTTHATLFLRTNGSSYTYKITANCLSANRYTNTTAVAVAFPNTCNFTNSAITETLTIPSTVPGLTATQSGAFAVVSWLLPTNIANPTTLNTQYSVSMFTNTGTVISNKYPYTDISYTFPITAGSSYVFTVNSRYYGIWATLSSGYSLTTINPLITSLTLTDNANKTATLAGAANTTGTWYYLLGNPVLWLDGADPNNTGTSAVGSTISTWKDKSGRGNNATAPPGGPALSVTASGVVFDGISGYLSVPGIAGTLSGTPFVVFAVETFNGNYVNKGYYFGDGVGGNLPDSALSIGYRQSGSPAGSGAYTMAFWSDDLNDTNFNTSSPKNVPRIWTNYLPSSPCNRNIRLNGSIEATHTNNTWLTSFTTPVIGRAENPDRYAFYTGVISELLVFNTDIGLDAIRRVEGYLAQKWGLQANLPSPGTWPTGTTLSVTTDTLTAGAFVVASVKFKAPVGLTDASSARTLSFPNPTITKCSVVDNQNGSLTLNLSATIGGSGTYTSYWTVPQTVGTLTLSTAPANLSSATAIYKTSTAGSSYTFSGITVSADGFTSDASSATLSTPSAFSIVDPTPSLSLLNGNLMITLTASGIEQSITCNAPQDGQTYMYTLPRSATSVTFSLSGGGAGYIGYNNGGACGSGGYATYASGQLAAGTVISYVAGTGADNISPGIPGGTSGYLSTNPNQLAQLRSGGGYSRISFVSNGTTVTVTAGGGAGGNSFGETDYFIGGTGGGGAGVGGVPGSGAGAAGGNGGFSGTSTGTVGGGAPTGTNGSVTFTVNYPVLPDASTIQWTTPLSIATGVNRRSDPPTGLATVNLSYGPVSTNATLTFPANSIAVKYQGYSVSYASAVTYTPPNPLVSATTSLTDNLNTTFSLNLSSTGTTGGYGNVVWTVPSSITGSVGGLSVSGATTVTGASAKVTYTGALANTSYAVSIGAITVSYSGISSSNSAQVVSAKTANPVITKISASYFGSVEDTPTNNSITLNISGNIPGTWTITKPTTINFTTSSGQGTANAVYNFSGGTRTSNYTLSATLTSGGFTSSVSSASVTLALPGGITPTIDSVKFHFKGTVVDGFNVATLALGIALGCTTTDTNFASFQPITVTSTTDTLVQSPAKSNLNTNTLYTLFVANQLNGILGDKNTCNIVVPGIPADIKYGSAAASADRSLATSNSIYISWTAPTAPPNDISDRFTYSVYKGATLPTQVSTSPPVGGTVTVSGLAYGTTNYQITSLPAGAQTYYVLSVYTNGTQIYYSPGASTVAFTYSTNNIVSTNVLIPTDTTVSFTTSGLLNFTLIGSGGFGSSSSKIGGGAGGGGGGIIVGSNFVFSSGDTITYKLIASATILTWSSLPIIAGAGGTGSPSSQYKEGSTTYTTPPAGGLGGPGNVDEAKIRSGKNSNATVGGSYGARGNTPPEGNYGPTGGSGGNGGGGNTVYGRGGSGGNFISSSAFNPGLQGSNGFISITKYWIT